MNYTLMRRAPEFDYRLPHRDPYPLVANVTVFYKCAEGRTRLTTFETPRGSENWTPDNWLSEGCVGPWARENWLRIEATRTRDGLRVAFNNSTKD